MVARLLQSAARKSVFVWLKGPGRAGQCSTAASMTSSLVACNIYVSDTRNEELLSSLRRIPDRFSKVNLAYSFSDDAYNRSSFTVVGTGVSQLAQCVAHLSIQAADALDLREHSAAHPRLGVVDHIVCQYLPAEGASAQAVAVDTAHRVAKEVSRALPVLPIALYGDACSHNRRLQDIRRACGYFKGANGGQWQGINALSMGVDPDFGPSQLDERMGMCTVGAVPLACTLLGVAPFTGKTGAGKKIAIALSERGGGLKHVEAMALPHGDGIEVACNLLRSDLTPATEVLQQCTSMVQRAGGKVHSDYVIGLSPDQLQQMLPELL